MFDPQVFGTQRWLNETYSGVTGWVPLEQDGQTGWATIYGLRRALQHELGVSPLSSGFGPATTAAFQERVGRIDSQATVSENILRVLSGALWCKGRTGVILDDLVTVTYGAMVPSVERVREDLGLGGGSYVDVKLMASLLSMDAYDVLEDYGGVPQVRQVQQWLNGTYAGRRDFALVPCDGVHSRQVQTALLMALQFEMGMADGEANGNFGEGTRSGLRGSAQVRSGSTDGATRFVRLFHAAMILNGYDVSLASSFGAGTEAVVRVFQSFMEIPETGAGDYTTWCSLLVSSGDTSVATKGFDTSAQLLGGRAQGAADRGYTHAGRYTVGSGKFITGPELDALRSAGLRLVPIHQRWNNDVSHMTYEEGRTQGQEALERGRVLGLPADSIIYFTVDFDPVGDAVVGPVMDFFRGVNEVMGEVDSYRFRVGVYATRNVCRLVMAQDYAVAAYVLGMSTGFSGNMGFPMPQGWHYNQIVEVSEDLGGRATPVDHVVVSRRAEAVDLAGVVSPPLEVDGAATETGFHVLFEWFVRAEVVCELALTQARTPDLTDLRRYLPMVGSFVLGWLRKPDYWYAAASGMWMVYTPDTDDDAGLASARILCEGRLTSVMGSRPAVTTDVAHWAAAAMGYVTWPGSSDPTTYGLGDLGGWMLDLYQLFGQWQTGGGGEDQETWMRARLAVEGVESGFGVADLVADADAWLTVVGLAEPSPARTSDTLRTQLAMSQQERLRAFYSGRFDSSPQNVVSMFSAMVDGIDVGGVNFPLSGDRLRGGAGAKTAPTPEQARICGELFAQALERLTA
ncbi:DUF1906 domain-containing protein [Actinomyces sp. 2119]|uniref:glycoside hydrolase domain-containing protein n=1 Tax=Actinomyces sp. 2119 TaxID=2321393 RepID=UPI000E6CFE5F|nr:glycoside hydrolase domain-containing protein [Actinomyces sp. 2119]RJF40472.1 DUF1906 domain-containing protein [Actinomyces sp. 2119]RJF41867.1 DUF1906 domain-containing protein [Actinomyces sp. 2119]